MEHNLWGPEVENLLENQTSVPSSEQEISQGNEEEQLQSISGINFSDDLFAPPGRSHKWFSRTHWREQAQQRILHINTMQQSQRDDPEKSLLVGLGSNWNRT